MRGISCQGCTPEAKEAIHINKPLLGLIINPDAMIWFLLGSLALCDALSYLQPLTGK